MKSVGRMNSVVRMNSVERMYSGVLGLGQAHINSLNVVHAVSEHALYHHAQIIQSRTFAFMSSMEVVVARICRSCVRTLLLVAVAMQQLRVLLYQGRQLGGR